MISGLIMAMGCGSAFFLLDAVQNYQSFQHANLRRSKADPRRVIHRLEHVARQFPHRVGHVVQCRRDLFQARVGMYQDGSNGHGPHVGYVLPACNDLAPPPFFASLRAASSEIPHGL